MIMDLKMETVVIQEGTNHKGQRYKVIAFYGNCGFMYTKTYLYDSDGYVEMSITVYEDGQVDIK